ncbi:MAG: DNA-3-methyladenine glycosylase 2 family protein, partial [Gammaproteobacteria bacterium]|nr:DNA-3-methyladenine glycosylase 2 family protein [Gammaproteobacteria bacterium]
RLIAAAGPCRIETALERPPFETLASAIAHQQLNGAVARRILARFTALYAPAQFPQPAAVAATGDAPLRAAGFSYSKIIALRDLADKVCRGVVPTVAEMHTLDNDAIVERITQVRGIGRWTVEMMLMFHLGRPDVLPVDDFGVCNGFRLAYGLKGMPRPRALAEFGARWAPHRSLAAWYLWRAVDLARERKLPRAGRAPRVALIQARSKPHRAKRPSAKRRRAAR